MSKFLVAALFGVACARLSGEGEQTRLQSRQWMYGIGETERCGAWRAEHANTSSTDDPRPIDAWIVGFVSGAGWSSGARPPLSVTPETILAAVDRECAQDPSAQVADAAAKAFLVRIVPK